MTEPKLQAKRLKTELATRTVELPLNDCQHIVAAVHGHANWQALSGSTALPASPAATREAPAFTYTGQDGAALELCLEGHDFGTEFFSARPPLAAATQSFDQAWAQFQAAGFQYGASAFEQLRFGWDIAHGRRPFANRGKVVAAAQQAPTPAAVSEPAAPVDARDAPLVIALGQICNQTHDRVIREIASDALIEFHKAAIARQAAAPAEGEKT